MQWKRAVLIVVVALTLLAAIFAIGIVRGRADGSLVYWQKGKPETAKALVEPWQWVSPWGRKLHEGGCSNDLQAPQVARSFKSPEGASLRFEGSLSFELNKKATPQEIAHCVEGTFPETWNAILKKVLTEAQAQTALDRRRSATRYIRNELEKQLSSASVKEVLGVFTIEDGPPALFAARPDVKLLLVGWDGADWDVIDPLLAAGELPHLNRLVQTGVRARLRSMAPILSPVVWTSIATGKVPAKHGIFDFLAKAEDGSMVPVTSSLRTARPIWDLLGAGGVPVSVTAWWATWPAEPVQGRMATDRIAYQLFQEVAELGARDDPEGKTWPPDLFEKLLPLLVSPENVSNQTLQSFGLEISKVPDTEDAAERVGELKTVLASTATYEAITHHHLEAAPTGFHATYFELTDTVAHVFMPFRPPAVASAPPDQREVFKNLVDDAYRHADRALGRLLAKLDDDWHVMLVSDHGFKHGENRPTTDPRVGHGPAADWHDRFGVFVFSGPLVKSNEAIEAVSILDITPTILALYGMPTAEDMDGRIIEEAFKNSLETPEPSIATYEYETQRPSRLAISSQDDALMEKLRSLGYIGGGANAGQAEANDVYQETTGVTQQSTTALNNLGVSQLSQGDLDGALETFEQALASGGGLPSLVNLANIHLIRRDLEAAEQVLSLLESENPNYRAIPSLRGRLADLQGDRELAAQWLDRAIQVDPADAHAITRRGHLAEEKGDLSLAQKYFSEAAKKNPENPDAPNYLGNVLRQAGDLKGAEEAYQAAITADPAYPGSYNNLGLLMQSQGRFKEAESILQRGIAKAPQSALLRNSLGVMYLAQNDPRAEAAFEQAIEFSADFPEAWNNLGVWYIRNGKTKEAVRAFKEALAIDAQHVDSAFNLAKVRMLEQNYKEAHRLFKQASDNNPSHLDAAIGAAETAFQAKDYATAKRYFERAQNLPGAPDRVKERLRSIQGQ